ncbi:transposon Tf2-9 polyprotein [Trichonephila clavipes]|nr:transposon Tf2-9 polyprotein [Trichonephila clavipes]
MVVLCTDKESVFQGNFGRTFWKNYMLTLRNSKMKAIARSFVYWKNIDNDIEEAAKTVSIVLDIRLILQKSKVHYWEYPSMPWERIHVDFAGPVF